MTRTTQRAKPLDGTCAVLCRRKAGREAIFAEIQALAAEYGATVERRKAYTLFELPLTIVAGPFGAMVNLDGRSGTAFIAHWYVDDYKSSATYPAGFERFTYSIHPARHKATTVCDYLDAFKLALRGGLALLVAETQKAA